MFHVLKINFFFLPWEGYDEDFCFILPMGWTPLVMGVQFLQLFNVLISSFL